MENFYKQSNNTPSLSLSLVRSSAFFFFWFFSTFLQVPELSRSQFFSIGHTWRRQRKKSVMLVEHYSVEKERRRQHAVVQPELPLNQQRRRGRRQQEKKRRRLSPILFPPWTNCRCVLRLERVRKGTSIRRTNTPFYCASSSPFSSSFFLPVWNGGKRGSSLFLSRSLVASDWH